MDHQNLQNGAQVGSPHLPMMMRQMRWGLAASLCVGLSVAASGQTYRSTPSDDIWVYGRAADGGGDPFLRVWGDGRNSRSDRFPPGDEHSYSYTKFNLGGIAPGPYFVTRAELKVRQRTTVGRIYTKADAEANPLEARALGTNFSEDTWNLFDPNTPAPGDLVYGTSSMANYNDTQDFDIVIDLLATPGAFEAAFNSAVNGDGQVAFALTSKLLVSGQSGFPYRLYSKESGLSVAPELTIEYQVVPEPGLMAAMGLGLAALAARRRRR